VRLRYLLRNEVKDRWRDSSDRVVGMFESEMSLLASPLNSKNNLNRFLPPLYPPSCWGTMKIKVGVIILFTRCRLGFCHSREVISVCSASFLWLPLVSQWQLRCLRGIVEQITPYDHFSAWLNKSHGPAMWEKGREGRSHPFWGYVAANADLRGRKSQCGNEFIADLSSSNLTGGWSHLHCHWSQLG